MHIHLQNNSQSKNDRKDPKVIAKLVTEGRYSAPYTPDGVYADLRIMVANRKRLIREMTQIKNRFARWFAIYFPEYTDVFGDYEAQSSMLLLKKVCTPEAIVELGAEKINQIWRDAKLRAVGMKRATTLCETAKRSIVKMDEQTARLMVIHQMLGTRISDTLTLARITILEMVEEGERVTVPKLMVQTGLSRGFFYKNPTVRKLVDEAVEKQAGMVDPRKGILDMVMDNEIAKLHEQIRLLRGENEQLKEENQRLKKALDKKNMNILKNL